MEGLVDEVARGVNAVELEDDQLPRLRVAELRAELRQRHLRVTGRKPELLTRLRAALLLERERVADEQNKDEEVYDEDDDEDVNSDTEAAYALAENVHAGGRHNDGRVLDPVNGGRRNLYDDNDDSTNGKRASDNMPVIRRRINESQRVLLTFQDVEGSLEKFSGDNHTNVQRWLNEFEEMALLCGWNDLHKVVYAKRLLEGSAKLFVQYEGSANTWAKLKKALKDEFEEAVDSLQVHRELSKRRKKPDETHQEYIYKMLQIAAQASLDVRTVIQYIIEGIPDDAVNKAVLYGAKDIKQLKERFCQYERMRQEMSRTKARSAEKKGDKPGSTEKPDKKKSGVSTTESARRCFNCGASDHLSVQCPEKRKGKKCFKCNEFGHIASECTAQCKDVYLVSRPGKDKYQKKVTIKDCKILALVDTGSDLTLMSESVYERLGSPPLLNKQVCFEGLGSEVNETVGSFTTNMTAEFDEFTV